MRRSSTRPGRGAASAGGAEIASLIRTQVHDTLQLTCSVGVASTKLVAKLASEAAKPCAGPDGVRPGSGVVVVRAGEELGFLHAHPVQALWGVGPATLDRLQRLGVTTVGDLAVLPERSIPTPPGCVNGQHLHRLANGIDDRPVDPHRPLKSVGHEETFAADHHGHATLDHELVRLCDSVGVVAEGRRPAERDDHRESAVP